MAKTLYKAKFEDKLPLGGIATGHITLGCDGSINLPPNESSNLSFFAIKAEKDGELSDARILQSNSNTFLSCFERTDSFSFFPFTEISFEDSDFPAGVKMTAFSPFIPLNDTDSGIPAVCFEFEISNKTNERTDFSLAFVTTNINEDFYNRMGCTDTGEAYIHLSGMQENSPNTCIATNGKNISFCEYVSSSEDFKNNFTKNSTLYNKTKSECTGDSSGGALCTHFTLGGNESTSLRFCLSWYTPENEFSRNYYAQYFESSLDCASYLFRQIDRLYSTSKEFCENIFGATLPESALKEINKDLFDFIQKKHLRLDDGKLISREKNEFFDIESFITRPDIFSSLFPALGYSAVEHFYKEELFESASDSEIAFAILKSYRKYILTADIDYLIEEWYYISKCLEKLFGEDGYKKCSLDNALLQALLQVAAELSEAVRDKKRYEIFSQLSAAELSYQYSINTCNGFAKINEFTDFSYNAVKNHISFKPISDSCPLENGDTFRCFFCTPSCFGYVEEGIDYIEINLLHGSVGIRSFGVPRTPRLVQYGGRNWRFSDTGKCALLDSELLITPDKKLTIFIDIKQ